MWLSAVDRLPLSATVAEVAEKSPVMLPLVALLASPPLPTVVTAVATVVGSIQYCCKSGQMSQVCTSAGLSTENHEYRAAYKVMESRARNRKANSPQNILNRKQRRILQFICSIYERFLIWHNNSSTTIYCLCIYTCGRNRRGVTATGVAPNIVWPQPMYAHSWEGQGVSRDVGGTHCA